MTPADAVLRLGRSLLGHPSLGPRFDAVDPAEDYYHRLGYLLLVRLVPDLARRRGLPPPPDLRLCSETQRLLPQAIDCPSLGELRQQLLELHPLLDVARGEFDLAPATHRRKTSGAYYTPPVLVECLLDSALGPVLEAALGRPDPEAALRGLRVCDPACGDGQFLVAAARRLAAALAGVRGRPAVA